MSDDGNGRKTSRHGGAWDTSSNEQFFEYYQRQSASDVTQKRFRGVCEMLLRVHARQGNNPLPLAILDIGCGAGAQSGHWEIRGHRYAGLDINEPLITLARQRAVEGKSMARFEVGSATDLPFSDASIDICLLPELLEHVVDWKRCIDEALRVTKPGGLIFINTSNKLCPIQQEFSLPLYSWYPDFLKSYLVKKSVTDWPSIVNHAKYPAVNWFSYYALRKYLETSGCACNDRFDVMDIDGKAAVARQIVALIRSSSFLRFIGQVMTPYTQVVAIRCGSSVKTERTNPASVS